MTDGAQAQVDVSIVTSGHDVADARIHRLVEALSDVGLRLEVLGLGDAAAAPPGARARVANRRTSVARAGVALRQAWRARGAVLLALDPDSLLAVLLVGRLRRRGVV